MKRALLVAVLAVAVLLVSLAAFRKQIQTVHTVELPTPAAPPAASAESAISLVVVSATACTLDGVAIDSAQLKERLVAAKAAGKNAVKLKSAGGGALTALAPVLDLVRQAGIEQVSIEATAARSP